MCHSFAFLIKFKMALLVKSLARTHRILRQTSLFTPRRSKMATSPYEEMGNYWNRNRKLGRPLSPFLSVYKPHLAMMTSLTHRVTGVVIQVVICGTSIILLCLPGDFKTNLQYIRDLNLHPVVVYGLKYVFAFPVTYHFLNGLRHLSWDAGYGFGLKTLYKSAYIVMALTAIVSTYFVFGIKPLAL